MEQKQVDIVLFCSSSNWNVYFTQDMHRFIWVRCKFFTFWKLAFTSLFIKLFWNYRCTKSCIVLEIFFFRINRSTYVVFRSIVNIINIIPKFCLSCAHINFVKMSFCFARLAYRGFSFMFPLLTMFFPPQQIKIVCLFGISYAFFQFNIFFTIHLCFNHASIIPVFLSPRFRKTILFTFDAVKCSTLITKSIVPWFNNEDP